METSTPDWRQDWVIDPDPLAAAQARHRSGYGVNLKSIGGAGVAAEDGPFVAAIYTDDSRQIIDRLFAELGFAGCRDWTEQKQEQARTLWRELGRDVDPNAQLPVNVPCAVASWRDQWTATTREGSQLPHLRHS